MWLELWTRMGKRMCIEDKQIGLTAIQWVGKTRHMRFGMTKYTHSSLTTVLTAAKNNFSYLWYLQQNNSLFNSFNYGLWKKRNTAFSSNVVSECIEKSHCSSYLVCIMLNCEYWKDCSLWATRIAMTCSSLNFLPTVFANKKPISKKSQ